MASTFLAEYYAIKTFWLLNYFHNFKELQIGSEEMAEFCSEHPHGKQTHWFFFTSQASSVGKTVRNAEAGQKANVGEIQIIALACSVQPALR